MNIITIALLGIITTLLVILLRTTHPDFGIIAGIAFGAAVLLFVTPSLKNIISEFEAIAQISGVANEILATSIKAVGISLIAEFAVSICNSAGETGIADKIEIAAKIIMLSLALPLINTALEGIFAILP